MRSSVMPTLFCKINESGDFWVSGKAKVSDSEKGTHRLVSSDRVSASHLHFFVYLIL